MPVESIRWDEDHATILDQTRLPHEERYLEIASPEAMFEAIQRLRVRGAPAIGVAAAFGLYLGVRDHRGTMEDLLRQVDEVAGMLARSRPTAVNLFWALDRMKGRARELAAADPAEPVQVREGLLEEALRMLEEDREVCQRIGLHGLRLLTPGMRILTHCNTGALATVGIGTALAPVFLAHERGIAVEVYADETRPLLQGARLTAWELQRAGIPVTLLCDGAAASLMARGGVDLVLVGADRVAANGDVANKVGTSGVALAAQAYGVPFYVASPLSTIDLGLATGQEIPIEERDGREVTEVGGVRIAPEGVRVHNPAFDVTPHRFITGIITERGIVHPPFEAALRELVR
ncbi:S-methyl-5-thioribose-1-phosphate isomerase [Limnochorda pilosa]|uniref:Methylthioribose-1-phosphate isomerase n=1 Tax=Limnochorda pilosa TaxID=1555112 RepID=A0A0K2SMC7_LIMPI|nr:S-methyl-5-thioribose-1-phosphate isomerase [Limnochorda pilosa]BAS28260.1 methylthioribose-1-phosphate isomerase [Limnochorda pilosa]